VVPDRTQGLSDSSDAAEADAGPQSAARPAAIEWNLIQQVTLTGSQSAFAELITPYQSMVRRYLRRLTRNEADADDLAQDVFINAWSRLSTFGNDGRFVSWLFAIAYRTFLQHKRGWRRYLRAVKGFHGDAGGTPATVSGEAGQAAADLERVMNALGEREQSLLLLSRGIGLTHREIAEVMEMPVGTVKSEISRTTRRIIDELG
jgi:RNA polymerase sigma-70 factor (ECF subfamily)